MDEFEGLATQFNSWVPDFDVDLDLGESSARRRRRQVENTSPLPPGHYRPQLFRYNQTQKHKKDSKNQPQSRPSSRYSETSKQIYLIDVDQRTMFSLQAVINDSVMVIIQMMVLL